MPHACRTCIVDKIKFKSLTDAALYIGVTPLYMSKCASKKYCKTIKGHAIKFGPKVCTKRKEST